MRVTLTADFTGSRLPSLIVSITAECSQSYSNEQILSALHFALALTTTKAAVQLYNSKSKRASGDGESLKWPETAIRAICAAAETSEKTFLLKMLELNACL